MAMLNTAAEDDLIAKNRCQVKGAGTERSDERPLISAAQALALADTIDPRYRAAVWIIATCGLRTGELLGLTRGDVDVRDRRIIVTKQRQELSTGIELRQPKTQAGTREIAMPASIVVHLQDHLDVYVGGHRDSPMFPGPAGGVRRATYYRAWHAAVAAAEVRADLKPHDLRHLANTMAARVPGTTAKDLMARMGHQSSAAALRYLHRSPGADRAMSEGIDRELQALNRPDADGCGDDPSV
jgi:integrase